MDATKNIFKYHQAQTFPYPSCLEVQSAKGNYITDTNGKILKNSFELILLLKNTNWKKL